MQKTTTKKALLHFLLSFSSFILPPSSFLSPASFVPAFEKPKVGVGMTAPEVRKILGAPTHVARQLLYQRYQEHWIYQNPSPVCLVFDWQRGQVPRLVNIRSPSPSPSAERGS